MIAMKSLLRRIEDGHSDLVLDYLAQASGTPENNAAFHGHWRLVEFLLASGMNVL
jgi:hypothetical protein